MSSIISSTTHERVCIKQRTNHRNDEIFAKLQGNPTVMRQNYSTPNAASIQSGVYDRQECPKQTVSVNQFKDFCKKLREVDRLQRIPFQVPPPPLLSTNEIIHQYQQIRTNTIGAEKQQVHRSHKSRNHRYDSNISRHSHYSAGNTVIKPPIAEVTSQKNDNQQVKQKVHQLSQFQKPTYHQTCDSDVSIDTASEAESQIVSPKHQDINSITNYKVINLRAKKAKICPSVEQEGLTKDHQVTSLMSSVLFGRTQDDVEQVRKPAAETDGWVDIQ